MPEPETAKVVWKGDSSYGKRRILSDGKCVRPEAIFTGRRKWGPCNWGAIPFERVIIDILERKNG